MEMVTHGTPWLLLGALVLNVSASCPVRGQEAAPQKIQAEGDSSGTSAMDRMGQPDEFERDTENKLGVSLLMNIAQDQQAIWTSPVHLRWQDADWLVPLGGATAAFMSADQQIELHLGGSANRPKWSRDFSNYGVGGLIGAGGGLYLWGRLTHEGHKRETGLLSGEALVDTLAVTTPLQWMTGRERPSVDEAAGKFGQGGNSFPSDHSAAAWSIASVIAHEYPGTLTKALAYGLASGVSISRVTGKEHFPSDVLVGSAIGWLVGQRVYRAHHNPEVGGGTWGASAELRDGETRGLSGKKGSPYVPLDSWVYPALERLAALGYVQTEFLDLRPWTRRECARLLEEAGEAMQGEEFQPAGTRTLYEALEREFAPDLGIRPGEHEQSLRVESIYTGVMDISGEPLRDSYHFGQTIIDDFGRPYGEGFNALSGFSGWAGSGRFAIYFRGEYQHAPGAPAYSQEVRNVIAQVDGNPVQPAQAVPTIDQFNLLDAYALMNLANWELSFGKQSLWWGPGEGGALLFSDNAEPIEMFRASRDAPFTLPWIFHHLGPVKLDAFFGKLSGNEFPPRPLIHGEKIAFEPTPNLELGFTFTSELGGVGRPLTLGAILNSYFSVRSSDLYAANVNPGKRTPGFEFTYKVPHLRNWLTLYSDALLPEEDNTSFDTSTSPIYAPRRTAMRPGIYLSRVPGVPKLDFRAEAVYTDPPTLRSQGGRYVYWNDFYHDLYTNDGNIIGDWIGREGKGYQAWSTYWFSPRNSIQVGYRHAEVAGDFIPGGETLNDGSVKGSWWVKRDLSLSAYVQYEKWRAPILAPGPQTNWTSSVEIAFWPHSWNR
jgi:hypothetical protein